MRRIRLVVAYDGTNYHGWQYQPNAVTIEEVLNKALTELLREPIAVIGASRTDAGVHARGNVAVFDTENRMAADKICLAVNQRLPEDIRVQSSGEVAPDWHPRKQRCVKTYHCYYDLDLEKMRRAASFIVGEHDFKSFCSAKTQVTDTVRTVYSLNVERDQEDVITIRITGSGFLYNMVRIIAGTLLWAGTGLIRPEEVAEILAAEDRRKAGPTAPAKGLTLIRMFYPDEMQEQAEKP